MSKRRTSQIRKIYVCIETYIVSEFICIYFILFVIT